MAARFTAVNIDCNFGYAFERERLATVGVALVERKCATEEEIMAACASADAVYVEGTKTPVTRRVIAGLPQCRIIAKYAVGVDNIDLAAATEAGVVVANAADYCTEEVSDHTMALLLSAARWVPMLDRRLRSGGWGGPIGSVPVRRLRSQTVGLVGLGRIARALVRKLSGFELRIVAFDPHLSADAPLVPGVEIVSLERVLRESDFISIHVPLTPQTRGMVNARLLGEMKKTAWLINTSRGPVVDQTALRQSLERGLIAGAALDVFESEPLPSEDPLRKLEQVILTPHIAADSTDSLQHARETMVDSVAAVLRGYWPPFPVNPEVKPRFPLAPWKSAPPLP